MQDFNQVTLIGRLTKDAELKDLNGLTKLDFSLAFNTSKKNGDKYVDESNFVNLSLWGKVATALKPYMIKGSQVLVSGELKQDRWEKDGQKFSALKVIANSVQLLGSRNSSESKAAKQEEPAPSSDIDYSGDIPF